MFRENATQENHTKLEEYASYISKCVNNVGIRKTITSFPNQNTWTNGEVSAFSLLVSWQRSIHYQSKTESWHQGGEADESGETKERTQHKHYNHVAGDPGHHRLQKQEFYQVSLNPFVLALISSTNIDSAAKSAPSLVDHSQYPQQMWGDSCWV